MATDARNRYIDSSKHFWFHLSLQEYYGGEIDYEYVFPVPVKYMKHDYLFTAMDAK
jgi:hypothetical protein